MQQASHVVSINELCIGCTKCIQACPVDAIIGAAKQMHVVLTEFCIGCNLCLPPCPMNCIDILPSKTVLTPAMRRERAMMTKKRYQARKQRLATLEVQKSQVDQQTIENDMEQTIAQAIAKVQQKRQSSPWWLDEPA